MHCKFVDLSPRLTPKAVASITATPCYVPHMGQTGVKYEVEFISPDEQIREIFGEPEKAWTLYYELEAKAKEINEA